MTKTKVHTNGRRHTDPSSAANITEEELANLKGQLAAISKAQAVIEFNLDGTIITANENFLNTVGYTLEEIQGQHHRMFAPPEYAASKEYSDFWAKLNQGHNDTGRYQRLGKGGKVIWIEASYNPIMDTDGNPFKVVKYATDITETVQKEIVNTRYASMTDNSPINTIYADTDLSIRYVNQASIDTLRTLEQYLPCKVDDIVGQ